MSLSAGTILGPYEILAPIGAGGMGEVYKARDTRLDRLVAIKLVHARFSDRFQQETRAIAQLNHPNICTLYDVGPDYLVMEYIEGETLKQKIASGAIPAAQALEIARQSAEGLAAAHRRGILHRDIKPGNIMVTLQGQAKIMDFGLAKLLESVAPDGTTATIGLTQPGMAVGTVQYMSPEQAAGLPLDPRSDIYSFGLVLQELCGDRLSRITAKALAKDPAARYQDLDALLVDLKKAAAPPRWRIAAVATVSSAVLIAIVAWLIPRTASRSVAPLRLEQLTAFSDYAVSPALSPDGKMLTFIRGPGTFITPGQVCVKLLPAGEPVELTHDGTLKMSPVFSADGSRIAYTVRAQNASWDTWRVPVLGGEPTRWLANASGLTWTTPHLLLFSEIKTGIHMALVAATDNRTESRDVYLPAEIRGMAHRSYLSPDGKSVLAVEMDSTGWLPCRLVPFDGSSPGKPVGPAKGRCTYAAWSPDGRWMYLNSDAGGSFQIWRQRFPDGAPEQLTSGPTEAEGLAIAPDGRSLITSIGLRQSAVWLHDKSGDRQVSAEGNALLPAWGDGFPSSVFSPDGRKLFYLLHKGGERGFGGGELWVADLASGASEALFPNIDIASYDIADDGRIVFSAHSEGKSRIWLARIDRRSAPRQLPPAEALGPVFAPAGEIYFRGPESGLWYLFALNPSTGATRKLLPAPTISTPIVSPDGEWIVSVESSAEGDQPAARAWPRRGGAPVDIGGSCILRWTRDGKALFLNGLPMNLSGDSRTFVIPLQPGKALPAIPPGGVRNEADFQKLRFTRTIAAPAFPGPTADTWAYTKEVVHRNLYRLTFP